MCLFFKMFFVLNYFVDLFSECLAKYGISRCHPINPIANNWNTSSAGILCLQICTNKKNDKSSDSLAGPSIHHSQFTLPFGPPDWYLRPSFASIWIHAFQPALSDLCADFKLACRPDGFGLLCQHISEAFTLSLHTQIGIYSIPGSTHGPLKVDIKPRGVTYTRLRCAHFIRMSVRATK